MFANLDSKTLKIIGLTVIGTLVLVVLYVKFYHKPKEKECGCEDAPSEFDEGTEE